MARAHSPVEDVIRTRVEEHPDAVWLKFRDETYTWAEVLSNIQRAANGLLELGVRPGERVAILMRNRPEFIWTHLGIVFIGALSVPVNTSQRGATLEHILADSDSVAMVFDDELRDAKHLGPQAGGKIKVGREVSVENPRHMVHYLCDTGAAS